MMAGCQWREVHQVERSGPLQAFHSLLMPSSSPQPLQCTGISDARVRTIRYQSCDDSLMLTLYSDEIFEDCIIEIMLSIPAWLHSSLTLSCMS
jgi:hypothetical protein